MEIQDILALVQAVADNGLTELKVDDGNVKLSLKKEHPVVNVVAGNTGAGSAGGGMQVAGVQMPDFGSFGAAGALAGTVAAGGAAQETGNAVANTGAAAKKTRCSSASMQLLLKKRRIWMNISTCWRKPKSATTASSARNSACLQ